MRLEHRAVWPPLSPEDKDGTTHSWGHLSFDQYQRDQTMVLESLHDGSESNVFFAINDDDEVDPITPELAAEWQRIKAMPSGPERTAAVEALRAKHPGSIVNIGLFGRGGDKAVTLQLLPNRACPLPYIAHLLGNAGVRMVEGHHGHLAESHVQETLRAKMPSLG